jgi:hypothetical protein
MSVLNPDPSLPSNPAPIFADTNAARGDEMRANNNKIWGNFTDLDSRIDANWLRTIYGDNAYGSTLATDLNAIAKSGFYTCYGAATGAPSTAYSWFVLHQNSAVGVASEYQRAVAFNSVLTVYERVKISSVWGAWKLAGDYASPRMDGFIVSNNVADAVNDIDISPGQCNDSTRTSLIKLTTALTKRLDATWSSGTNGGLLQSGQTKAANKTYKIYVISSTDGSLVDIMATSHDITIVPPTGYTKYRYIYSIRTIAAGSIQLFTHCGAMSYLHNDTAIFSGTGTAGTTTPSVSVIPLGLTCPIVRVDCAQSTSATTGIVFNNILPSGVFANAFIISTLNAGRNQISGELVLNAAYQYQQVISISGASIDINVRAYVDTNREAF